MKVKARAYVYDDPFAEVMVVRDGWMLKQMKIQTTEMDTKMKSESDMNRKWKWELTFMTTLSQKSWSWGTGWKWCWPVYCGFWWTPSSSCPQIFGRDLTKIWISDKVLIIFQRKSLNNLQNSPRIKQIRPPPHACQFLAEILRKYDNLLIRWVVVDIAYSGKISL